MVTPKIFMVVHFEDGHIEKTDLYSLVSEHPPSTHWITYETSRGLYGHQSGMYASSYDQTKNQVMFTTFVDYFKYDMYDGEWKPTNDIKKAVFEAEEGWDKR